MPWSTMRGLARGSQRCSVYSSTPAGHSPDSPALKLTTLACASRAIAWSNRSGRMLHRTIELPTNRTSTWSVCSCALSASSVRRRTTTSGSLKYVGSGRRAATAGTRRSPSTAASISTMAATLATLELKIDERFMADVSAEQDCHQSGRDEGGAPHRCPRDDRAFVVCERLREVDGQRQRPEGCDRDQRPFESSREGKQPGEVGHRRGDVVRAEE